MTGGAKQKKFREKLLRLVVSEFVKTCDEHVTDLTFLDFCRHATENVDLLMAVFQ